MDSVAEGRDAHIGGRTRICERQYVNALVLVTYTRRILQSRSAEGESAIKEQQDSGLTLDNILVRASGNRQKNSGNFGTVGTIASCAGLEH